MLTFLSLHASSCKKQIILLKPTNKRVVKCKRNILSNQMWRKSCSRNVLYHSYPKLTPVTQSRSHILRNKKIWIPDRLVKNRTYNGVFDSFVFSLRFMVKGHYNRFSANQIWTDSNSRFVELLNFCITFVLPTLTWKYWEFNRAFEFLWWFDWLCNLLKYLVRFASRAICELFQTSTQLRHYPPHTEPSCMIGRSWEEIITILGFISKTEKMLSDNLSCSCMKIFRRKFFSSNFSR